MSKELIELLEKFDDGMQVDSNISLVEHFKKLGFECHDFNMRGFDYTLLRNNVMIHICNKLVHVDISNIWENDAPRVVSIPMGDDIINCVENVIVDELKLLLEKRKNNGSN